MDKVISGRTANNTLVKECKRRCNALFNKREKKAATMHASGQVYTQVLNKAIEDTQRKAKAHTVLEFNRHDIQFLV
ncbi:hypothetical protein JHK82_050096 [Glycine max]|nr:hypothetical protein JHK82_050096 [Glycine max]